jgi:hypothetical protein
MEITEILYDHEFIDAIILKVSIQCAGPPLLHQPEGAMNWIRA